MSMYDAAIRKLEMTLKRQEEALAQTKAQIEGFKKLQDMEKNAEKTKK